MCDEAGDAGTAVAVFHENGIVGEVVCKNSSRRGIKGISLHAVFTKLPAGKHGFHIHRLGDLRGEGCKGACEHFHVGPPAPHGGEPGSKYPRHTGDLGNIQIISGSGEKKFSKRYFIEGIQCSDIWGRALIVHADEDDLGLGKFADSITTGHSGARIGCAVFGRAD